MRILFWFVRAVCRSWLQLPIPETIKNFKCFKLCEKSYLCKIRKKLHNNLINQEIVSKPEGRYLYQQKVCTCLCFVPLLGKTRKLMSKTLVHHCISNCFTYFTGVFVVRVTGGGYDAVAVMLLPDETYEQSAAAASHLLAVLRVYDDFLARYRIRPEFFCRWGNPEKLHIQLFTATSFTGANFLVTELINFLNTRKTHSSQILNLSPLKLLYIPRNFTNESQ